MPSYAPMTPGALVSMVVDRCLARPGRTRVAVDGADAAAPADLARRIAARLRPAGRAAKVVELKDFMLPASQRLEFGRQDPDSYRERWFDFGALAREVLDPLAAPGPAQWLPRLRDPETDRSVRDRRQPAPDGLVLLAAGPMLLGHWLDFDLSVALQVDERVLRERTPAELAFTVDGVLEHERERSEEPDILVRYNHPERPAVAAAA
ncbi:nucleoside/nucleotide kinase family protein [Sinomonas soli]